MKRALIRKCARGGEGKRGALFNFLGGSAEDGAQFEETHVANVAMEIAGNSGEHARNERWAQHAGFFAERIAERDNLAGDWRGERGFSGGAEGAGDGFVESSGKQSVAYGGFGFGPGQAP